MIVNGKEFDREKIMHGVATAFAQVELVRALGEEDERHSQAIGIGKEYGKRYSSIQEQTEFLVESYCSTLGYIQRFTDDYLTHLILEGLNAPSPMQA